MPVSPHDGSNAEARGVIASVAALIGAKLDYLRARCELAGLEGKEAAVNYAIILALAVCALVVIVFAYLFLIIAIVFLIALAFDSASAWIWVMMGAGVLHLLIAGGCLYVAKMRLDRRMFGTTLDEFRKDKEWLTKIGKKN